MRFDCLRLRHRLVVASPWRFAQHAWNSIPPQICSQSARQAGATDAVTAQLQHTVYVSIAAIATGAVGPAGTIGRRSVIRW